MLRTQHELNNIYMGPFFDDTILAFIQRYVNISFHMNLYLSQTKQTYPAYPFNELTQVSGLLWNFPETIIYGCVVGCEKSFEILTGTGSSAGATKRDVWTMQSYMNSVAHTQNTHLRWCSKLNNSTRTHTISATFVEGF